MILRTLTLIYICASLLLAQNNNNFLTKFKLAESYENSGDLKSAVKLYEELVQTDTTNTICFESLNRVYVQLKNYAASVNLVESEIIKRPKDVNLYGLLGSTYYMIGNEEKAFTIWDEALKIAELNAVYYRVIAAYAVERRAFEKAIDIYKRGKEISRDKVIFSFDLARLYSLTMQYGKSVDEYCSILLNDPSMLQTVETKILADVNKPDALKAAVAVVEDYVDDNNVGFSYLLARLSIENKDYEKAFELYLQIDKKQSLNGAELYRYAHLLFSEGEYEVSKKVFLSIIERFPASSFSPASKLGYAKTLEALLMREYSEQIPVWKPFFTADRYDREKVKAIVIAFTEVIESYKNSEITFEALLRIGMINFHLLKDFDEAKINFNKVITSGYLSLSTAEAFEGLGEISLINGDLEEAERNFLQITVLARAGRQIINNAKYKLARTKLFQKNYSQTQKLLSEILMELKDNSANDALELSLLVNTSKSDSVSLALFADAEFLSAQEKYSEAAEKYKLLADNPRAFIFHSIASLRYAEMYLAQDKYTESIDLFRQIIDEGEKNIYADKALYLLAQIFEYGIGDNARAIEMYESLLAKFPASIYIDKARAEIIKLRDKIS
jgi:tetratricopeptide (TPR) repeat protein